MGFEASILKVLTVSPRDTRQEHDAIAKAMYSWNAEYAEQRRTYLAPWHWETRLFPETGRSAQVIVNTQIAEHCDLVIAAFNSSLGSATSEVVSNVARDIIHIHSTGKPIYIYLRAGDFPSKMPEYQVRRVNDFQDQMHTANLLNWYSGIDDLQYQVRKAIERDLTPDGR